MDSRYGSGYPDPKKGTALTCAHDHVASSHAAHLLPPNTTTQQSYVYKRGDYAYKRSTSRMFRSAAARSHVLVSAKVAAWPSLFTIYAPNTKDDAASGPRVVGGGVRQHTLRGHALRKGGCCALHSPSRAKPGVVFGFNSP